MNDKKDVEKIKNISPYLNAKIIYNNILASNIAQNKIWKIVAGFSGLVAVISVFGVIYIGSQSKFVPYLVAVPQTSHVPFGVSEANVASVDNRIIESFINNWIINARIVSSDPVFEKNAIFKVFDFVKPQSIAQEKINEDFSQNDRFVFSEKHIRDVQILDIIKQTNNTYQIDWIEIVRDVANGDIEEKYQMKGLVTMEIIPASTKTTEEQMRKNPLGLYITNFNWTKQNNEN